MVLLFSVSTSYWGPSLYKTVRVAVFAEGPSAEEARAAGADVVGGDELIEEIRKGTLFPLVCYGFWNLFSLEYHQLLLSLPSTPSYVFLSFIYDFDILVDWNSFFPPTIIHIRRRQTKFRQVHSNPNVHASAFKGISVGFWTLMLFLVWHIINNLTDSPGR